MATATKAYTFEVTHDSQDGWIVSDGYTLCYGHGDTIEEALREYGQSVMEWADLEAADKAVPTKRD